MKKILYKIFKYLFYNAEPKLPEVTISVEKYPY